MPNLSSLLYPVLLAVASRAGYAAAAEPACGLGPPPGSKAFSEARQREAEEARRTGYLTVCEANLERYDLSRFPKPPQSMQQAQQPLAFQPVDLSGTPFARLASLGRLQESVGDIPSRLYRSFRTADGRTLTLFEHDMSADGVQAYRDPKSAPERVNGLPARLVVLQAKQRAVSVLSWIEGRRIYELWLDANVARETGRREALFALAAALPKSIPARPDEAQRPPMQIGPDGLPVVDMPPTLPPDFR